MRSIEQPPGAGADPARASTSSSVGELARGRRLVLIIVLTTCLWLVAVMALWAGAAPEFAEDLSPVVGEAIRTSSDQAQRF